MSFFTKRKFRKLFKNPKLFFYDFFRVRGQQLFGIQAANDQNKQITFNDKGEKVVIKVTEVVKAEGKPSAKPKPAVQQPAQFSTEQIATLTPPKYADFFIKELKRTYTNKYDGLTYPLLDETIFLENQHDLKAFWKPFTESFLSQGIREEKSSPKKTQRPKNQFGKKR